MPKTLSEPQTTLDENAISLAIINAQYALKELQQASHSQAVGVLVLVNGIETSGKGEAVTALRAWCDPRLLKVQATTGEMPSEFQPIWQRHTAMLPRHGTIMVYFGNWYADLMRYVFEAKKAGRKVLKQAKFAQLLADIEAFETDLQNNGTHIVKFWFEIDKKTLKKRLHDRKKEPKNLFYFDWDKNPDTKGFIEFAKTLRSLQKDWHIIDGTNQDTANLTFANLVLRTAQNSLASVSQTLTQTKTRAKTHNSTKPKTTFTPHAIPALLKNPLAKVMDKATYKAKIDKKQAKLAKLLRQRGQRHIVFMFEGMDAAGKGGAIKRIIDRLDPREYEIHPIAAPLQYELQHPYLWRFWTRLPQDKMADLPWQSRNCVNKLPPSKIAIFDRSWYGRVLVERVEGFATPETWQRGYAEINRFEEDIAQSNGMVLKFWLAISNAEELKRFKARENTPDKQFKITADDWRNREKWDDYVQAAADMLALTSTEHSPWHVIATDDKYAARLMVLDKAIEQLESQL